jgi:hypothetical protein
MKAQVKLSDGPTEYVIARREYHREHGRDMLARWAEIVLEARAQKGDQVAIDYLKGQVNS